MSIKKKNIPEFFKNIFVDLESSFSGATQFFSPCHRYSVNFILNRPNNNRSTRVTSLSHPPTKPELVNKQQDKSGPMIFLNMLKTKKANLMFVWPCVTCTMTSVTNKMQQNLFFFIDSFKLDLHVFGDSFAHLQEHFECVYIFLEQCTDSAVCCRPVGKRQQSKLKRINKNKFCCILLVADIKEGEN